MKPRTVISSLYLTFFLASCASIIHGTSDQVTINSTEPNTAIYIDGAIRGKNTAVADLKRGQTHLITVKKENCEDVFISTTKKFDPASLLGILIDLGIVSIPLDFAIGGAQKTDPLFYTVNPVCTSTKKHRV